MGCPCELCFYVDTRDDFSNVAEKCMREIRRFEKKYSRYRPDSMTSTINGAAGGGPVRVDRETASILEYAAVCHEQSDGAFDITSGVFRKLWYQGRTKPPPQSEIDGYLERVGWNKVHFAGRQVRLPLPGMELDFGGVIKEYAADAAVAIARKAGVRHGLINLGGDVCIVGPQENGRPWPIGIVHPGNTDASIATVGLEHGALATSGGYERFVEIDGKRYSHLIDPRTGWPVEGLLSVSVIADQAIVAGSVASVASLQHQSEGLDWLERCGMPYLAIDAQLTCHGSVLASRPS